MSTSNSNLSIESLSVTVLLDVVTEQMGDDRLSQLIRQKLVQVFECAEASKKEAAEKEACLDAERISLREKKEELEAEQLALQEQERALHRVIDTLKDLPERVEQLSSSFDKLNNELVEEVQAANEAGSSFDSLETKATDAATALDELKTQVGALTEISTSINALDTTIKAVQLKQNDLVKEMVSVVGKVGNLATEVGSVKMNLNQVPTKAKVEHIVKAELKSTSDVLETLATKADLDNWTRAEAAAQAKSTEDVVKAALEQFQKSAIEDYSQKLAAYDAAEKANEKAFDELKAQALALKQACNEREQRLEALQAEKNVLEGTLQNQNRELAGQSDRLGELTGKLTQAEARIGRRNTTISEAQARISERDDLMVKAEEQIRTMHTRNQKNTELLESYKEAIKTKDGAIAEMSSRLEAAEAQATPPVTQHPETRPSGAGMLSRLAKVYHELSIEFRDIPTSNGSYGGFDLREIAIKIAPKLMDAQAKPMILQFLSSGAEGWHCLQQVAEQGPRAESVPEGTCTIHQEGCILVQAVEGGNGPMLNFYHRR